MLIAVAPWLPWVRLLGFLDLNLFDLLSASHASQGWAIAVVVFGVGVAAIAFGRGLTPPQVRAMGIIVAVVVGLLGGPGVLQLVQDASQTHGLVGVGVGPVLAAIAEALFIAGAVVSGQAPVGHVGGAEAGTAEHAWTAQPLRETEPLEGKARSGGLGAWTRRNPLITPAIVAAIVAVVAAFVVLTSNNASNPANPQLPEVPSTQASQTDQATINVANIDQAAATLASSLNTVATDAASLQSAETSLNEGVASVNAGLVGVQKAAATVESDVRQHGKTDAYGGTPYCGDADSVQGDADSVQGDVDSVTGDEDSLNDWRQQSPAGLAGPPVGGRELSDCLSVSAALPVAFRAACRQRSDRRTSRQRGHHGSEASRGDGDSARTADGAAGERCCRRREGSSLLTRPAWAEIDGPMVLHGLQEMHGVGLLVVPRRKEWWPREVLLDERYEAFRRAG